MAATALFPGHAKSIQRHVDQVPEPSQRNSQGVGYQGSYDDVGNSPTSSLWVGKVPLGTSSAAILSIFSRHGSIASISPSAGARVRDGYAFINFETITDAMSAFRELNQCDVFHTGKSILIRYTMPQSSQQPVKVPLKRASTNETSAPLRRENGSNQRIPLPTGPRALRTEPRPLPKKADSYRPEGRRIQPDIYRPDHRRTSYDSYKPAQVDGTRSPSAGRRSPPIETRKRRRESDALGDSDYFGRFETQRTHGRPSLLTTGNNTVSPPRRASIRTEDVDSVANATSSSSNEARERHTSSRILKLSDYFPRRVGLNNSSVIESERDRKADPPTGVVKIDTGVSKPKNISEDIYSPQLNDTTLSPVVTTAVEVAMTDAEPVSPSTPRRAPDQYEHAEPMTATIFGGKFLKRFRTPLDETASVVSDVTTSSKNSVHRRRCADCRKVGSDIIPSQSLTRCSMCSRRFHACCGNPRPSLSKPGELFTCGRCLRKQKDTNRSPTKIVPILCLDEIPDSAVLSHETVIPPLKSLRSSEARLHQSDEHFYTLLDTEPSEHQTLLPGQHIDVDGTVEACQPSLHSTRGSISDPQSKRRSISKAMDYNPDNMYERVSKLYKALTCPWWLYGNQCRVVAEDCLFAHTKTDAVAPWRREPSKNFTCWEWRAKSTCSQGAKCRFTHHDTGLHIGRDNKVSLKHLECHWWKNNGCCRFSDDECLYAHEATGGCSKEPGSFNMKHITCPQWQRGSCQRSVDDCFYSHYDTGVYTAETRSRLTATTVSQSLLDNTESGATTSSRSTSNPPGATSRLSLKLPTLSNNVSGLIQNPKPLPTPAETPKDSTSTSITDNDNTTSVPGGHAPALPARSTMEEENATKGDIPVNGDQIEPDNLVKISQAHEFIETLSPSSTHDFDKISADIYKSFGIPQPSGSRKVTAATAESERGPTTDPRKRRSKTDHTAQITTQPVTPRAENHAYGMFNTQSGRNHMPEKDATTRKSSSAAYTEIQSASKLAKCDLCSKTIMVPATRCSRCSKVLEGDANGTELSPIVLESPDASIEIVRSDRHSTRSSIHGMLGSSQAHTDITDPQPTHLRGTFKRKLTDDVMFVSKKRPRIDASSCLQAAKIPVAIVGEQTGTAALLVVDSVRSPLGEEDAILAKRTTSLEELTRLERLKKGTPVASTPAHEVLQRDMTMPTNDSIFGSTHVRELNSDGNATVIEEDLICLDSMKDIMMQTGEERSDSPLFVSQDSLKVNTGNKTSSLTRECPEISETTKVPAMPTTSPGLDNPRSLETLVEPPTVATAPTDEGQSDAFLPRPLASPSHPSRIHTIEESEFVESPSRLTVRKSCQKCRSKKKRCLHDAQGNYDRQACKKLLDDRKHRQDSSRSKKENDNIYRTAYGLPEDYEVPFAPGSSTEMVMPGQLQRTELFIPVIGDNTESCSKTIPDSNRENDSEDDVPLFVLRGSGSRIDTTQHEKQTNPAANQVRIPSVVVSARPPVRRIAGWMFEEDSDPETSDDATRASTAQVLVQRRDPLYQPRTSRNLFNIAPELRPKQDDRESNQFLGGVSQRGGKKGFWKNLLAIRCQERINQFGDPHHEVSRHQPEQVVTTTIQRHVQPLFTNVPVLETSKVKVTFAKFLGVPDQPVVCRGRNNKELAYRDGKGDKNRSLFRGLRTEKRVTEEEKFPFIKC